MRDPIREMEIAASKLLPKAPGILIPGWFWQEWFLLGIALAAGLGIVLLIAGFIS